MCSLQEHSARSAREHEAQQQEPIYAELAKERGLEWEAASVNQPSTTEGGVHP